MICKNSLLIVFLLLFVSCKRQNECECTRMAKSALVVTGNIDYYNNILLMNKSVIPCFIDSIDSKKKEIVTFVNPMSSTLHPFMLSNQRGIRYAYLIEFILSKDSVETINKTWSNDDLVHWAEITKPFRIYPYGVIVKKDGNNKPILEPLIYEDMLIIKEMYLKWWTKNKEKPIEILRQEWKKNGPILSGDYIWI